MEIAGLALGVAGLAGLFNVCVQCFDMIQLGRARNRDFEVLHTKLDNQKVRFMIWGQVLGFDEATRSQSTLERPDIRSSIVRTMQCIIGLFQESNDITGKYGLGEESSSKTLAAQTGNNASALRETFRRFQARINRSSKDPRSTTLRWVIVDQKKFLILVQDLRELIDDLESITRSSEALARQRVIVTYEIGSVSDIASLELVEDAATDSQDVLSSAASSRIETLSLSRQTGVPGQDAASSHDSFVTAPTSIMQVMALSDQPVTSIITASFAEPQNQRVINFLKNARTSEGVNSLRVAENFALAQRDKFKRIVQSNKDNFSADAGMTQLELENPHLPDGSRSARVEAESSSSIESSSQSKPLLPGYKYHTVKRILRELSLQHRYDPAMTHLTFVPIVNDISNLLATFFGFPDTPYEGGIFYIRVSYPRDYPWKPPRIWFLTKIFHPNIDPRGNICIDTLEDYWTRALDLSTILLMIVSILDHPNPNDPLVPEIAEQYINDRALYDQNARSYTQVCHWRASIALPINGWSPGTCHQAPLALFELECGWLSRVTNTSRYKGTREKGQVSRQILQ
ncbi:hypothetical protein MMC13_001999 [Lambiella insularis]|nr:hypothetical protein [Lambiella insularis]